MRVLVIASYSVPLEEIIEDLEKMDIAIIETMPKIAGLVVDVPATTWSSGSRDSGHACGGEVMCQIDTGSGCWGYMCNECQEEWNKDRADRDALREALRETNRFLRQFHGSVNLATVVQVTEKIDRALAASEVKP